MPVQTAIQLRRGTAASWTSTNPTLAAGEVGVETDTRKIKIGDGTTAWASLKYANIPQTTVTTKGDLLAASAADTVTRLAAGTNETRLVADSAAATGLKYVADTTNYAIAAKGDLLVGTAADTVQALTAGSNGDTLVADSAATTGLRWQGNYAAGKNKIINGDFTINQRSFSTVTTTTGSLDAYGLDQWKNLCVGGTGSVTHSVQSFTPGTAPVAGYEATQFMRIETSGQSAAGTITRIEQRIEDVRTFAGQTATFSFWAKAASGTPSVALELSQAYGTGGSPSSQINIVGGKVTLSTSWQRYSVTVAVPSLSGKTLGTTANTSSLVVRLWVSAGTDFNARTGSLGIQSNTFDIWGVQAEAGNVATAFQTATGTLQGELAACQRYYEKSYNLSVAPGTAYTAGLDGIQLGGPSGNIDFAFYWKITKRAEPTMTIFDAAGATGVVSAYTGSWLNGQAIAGSRTKENYGCLDTNIASSTIISFQYVASAEL